ncbi:PCYCGC motif-containing (lipo)protein [Polycladomyces subterraneus]|uniref:PCYCGC domain-containing protein n=1 Tax=Polycladomyces subterraneus TaxID=1016997 RepID=A0ABT8IS07_9BACL|nr:PCYCGC motif-containing (lipo)protein [Polycladomyces subterraneus]MDN4595246.1 PCYCGC domain-containing protein [Polycladomyces subterraneus]
MKRWWIGTTATLMFIASGCAAGTDAKSGTSGHERHTSGQAMPTFVEQSTVPHVREAYAFAAANADQLQYIPCYCGCGSLGHKSVKSCFIAGKKANGQLEYNVHGSGCEICVHVVLDAKKGFEAGKSLQEVRQQIEQKYGPQLSPTNTPAPPDGM